MIFMCKLLCLGIGICFILLANIVIASAAILGAKNLALAGAATVTGADYFSGASNPASSAFVESISWGIAASISEPKLLSLDYERSSTTPEWAIKEKKSSSSERINKLNVGMVIPVLSGPNLSFSIVGSVPVKDVAAIYTMNSREASYLTYNSKNQVPEVYTSLGIKLGNRFSLGAGLFYSSRIDGNVLIRALDTDAGSRMEIALKPILTPYFGILYASKEGQFLLGAAYKGQQHCKLKIDVDANFESTDESIQPIPIMITANLLSFYKPESFALGSAYKVWPLTLYLGVEKKRWSKYKAPVLALSVTNLDDFSDNHMDNRIRLKDTSSYHFGIEMERPLLFSLASSPEQKLSLWARAGVGHETSALRAGPRSLSVLDTAKTIISFGLGVGNISLKRLFVHSRKFQVGLAAAVTLLDKKALLLREDFFTERARVGGEIYTLMGEIGVEY
ncbi:MAG: hypothetical protein HQK52_18865 [Oligoflexia bacterium]|nr:hypothetical protein [Oligoflexia bacterium]